MLIPLIYSTESYLSHLSPVKNSFSEGIKAHFCAATAVYTGDSGGIQTENGCGSACCVYREILALREWPLVPGN